MKIKTITCHEVYNHGASLQEYALLEHLKSLGHEAKTLHYKPPYLSGHFDLWKANHPKWGANWMFKVLYLGMKLPSRLTALKRKASFDAFAQKYIPTDSVLYETNQDLKANIPDADAYITGSDQVWNSYFQNGKDPAFYLDFVPDDKLKISYAPSFAIDEIADELKPFVKEKVSRIDHISVRETSGKAILENLGISQVTQVLDPVFLLPATHWREKFISPENGRFIFIYDFDRSPVIEELAKRLAREHDLKIYTVNQNLTYADKNFWKDGPEKFLSLMNQATFVITNSFHSVAFSIIFEKQFCVVNRTEKINTRMRDLLGLFGLGELLISQATDIKNINVVDYTKIQTAKEIALNRSKEFLNNALS